jgi:flagellar protein FliS
MVNPYGNLLEETVLAASPMELTNMLFEKLLSEIRKAKDCLGRGEAASRNASASKAVEIVVELMNSLDHDRGGEISRSLRQLYAYALEQLMEGNSKQSIAGFENAESVIAPLADAWQELTGHGDHFPVEGGGLSALPMNESGLGAFSFSG